MSGQTRRLGDREIEVYTDIEGDSMLFIKWSDKQTLLSRKQTMTLEEAEALKEVLSSVDTLNMKKHWLECFADEPNGWFPCGEVFADWKARKDAES